MKIKKIEIGFIYTGEDHENSDLIHMDCYGCARIKDPTGSWWWAIQKHAQALWIIQHEDTGEIMRAVNDLEMFVKISNREEVCDV